MMSKENYSKTLTNKQWFPHTLHVSEDAQQMVCKSAKCVKEKKKTFSNLPFKSVR